MRLKALPLAAIGFALMAGLAARVFATSPEPVAWSYPALRGLCYLEASVAADGVSAAYPIGQVALTKSGAKWVCTEAVVRQEPAAYAGVWIKVR